MLAASFDSHSSEEAFELLGECERVLLRLLLLCRVFVFFYQFKERAVLVDLWQFYFPDPFRGVVEERNFLR